MTAILEEPTTTVTVGELRGAALAGGAAPAELGGRCRRIVDGAIDDEGNLALSVDLADSAATGAVLLVPGGAVAEGPVPTGGGVAAGHAATTGVAEVVALAGDAAPGGGRYRAFREVDMADCGHLLFRAELTGCAATEGLFLRTGTSLRVVARADQRGAPAYASFAQPTVTDGGAAAPSLAFVATLADGRSCVVQQPPHQSPALVLCTGTPLGDEVVEDNLVISRLGMGLCCVARVRRADRHLTKALIVTSSVVSPGDWVQTGARLPDHGRISRLLTPPAVCAQLGLVTVGFDDGRMALCTRPLAAEPTVVLASGDPVPGLHGETVHRIGAPVASSSADMQIPFGVACSIRLRSGRAALWVGVFGGQLPLEGAAIVPWLDGERAADRPELPVGRVSPVKFGNDGTLLLRAVLGQASERRSSLLALPGLFDWYRAGDSPAGDGLRLSHG